MDVLEKVLISLVLVPHPKLLPYRSYAERLFNHFRIVILAEPYLLSLMVALLFQGYGSLNSIAKG